MFDYLEKMRARSPGERRVAAFSIAFLLTGLLFIVWIVFIYPSQHSTTDAQKKYEENTPSPFAGIWGTFTSGIEDISANVSALKSMYGSVYTFTVDHPTTTSPQVSTPPEGQ